jgi:hypothetical protein
MAVKFERLPAWDIAYLGKTVPKDFDVTEVDYIVKVSQARFNKYRKILFAYANIMNELKWLIEKQEPQD